MKHATTTLVEGALSKRGLMASEYVLADDALAWAQKADQRLATEASRSRALQGLELSLVSELRVEIRSLEEAASRVDEYEQKTRALTRTAAAEMLMYEAVISEHALNCAGQLKLEGASRAEIAGRLGELCAMTHWVQARCVDAPFIASMLRQLIADANAGNNIESTMRRMASQLNAGAFLMAGEITWLTRLAHPLLRRWAGLYASALSPFIKGGRIASESTWSEISDNLARHQVLRFASDIHLLSAHPDAPQEPEAFESWARERLTAADTPGLHGPLPQMESARRMWALIAGIAAGISS